MSIQKKIVGQKAACDASTDDEKPQFGLSSLRSSAFFISWRRSSSKQSSPLIPPRHPSTGGVSRLSAGWTPRQAGGCVWGGRPVAAITPSPSAPGRRPTHIGSDDPWTTGGLAGLQPVAVNSSAKSRVSAFPPLTTQTIGSTRSFLYLRAPARDEAPAGSAMT